MLEQNDTMELLMRALAEDLGTQGDITSQSIFNPADCANAVIKSKATGIVAGTDLLTPLFSLIDKNITVERCCTDGARLIAGTIIARLQGPVIGLLSGERIALNFLQHLSGIATATSHLAQRIAHTKCRLLDTRKTTPGLRLLEKKAVLAGGGCNHRIGLYDMILIKDTHVKAAGGTAAALQAAQQSAAAQGLPVGIEIEVASCAEFLSALPLRPQRIMLDNMTIADMAWCVRDRNQKNSAVELEASGNVGESTIVAIAETGVDFISCGAITHSVMALDIHMIIE